MKHLFILLALALAGCAAQPPPPTPTPLPPLSKQTLKTIRADLEQWAEGRWENVSARETAGVLVLNISADRRANDTALAAYCQTLANIAAQHAPGHPWQGKIYVSASLKRTCP